MVVGWLTVVLLLGEINIVQAGKGQAIGPGKTRVWKDSMGKYSCEASYYGYDTVKAAVVLHKANGPKLPRIGSAEEVEHEAVHSTASSSSITSFVIAATGMLSYQGEVEGDDEFAPPTDATPGAELLTPPTDAVESKPTAKPKPSAEIESAEVEDEPLLKPPVVEDADNGLLTPPVPEKPVVPQPALERDDDSALLTPPVKVSQEKPANSYCGRKVYNSWGRLRYTVSKRVHCFSRGVRAVTKEKSARCYYGRAYYRHSGRSPCYYRPVRVCRPRIVWCR